MSVLLEDLPLPPPSQRRLLGSASTPPDGPLGEALRLLTDHAAVLLRLSQRSKADFRPLPVLLQDRLAQLSAAFTEEDPLPPSLLGELAPLLRPRLLRLGERLRCRLGRTRCELPLSRLREMDPASLRRNLRRPGRDLVDKAGPRQQLCGVRRIEKYDTQENRVLVAACARFERESGEVLRHIAKGRRKAHEHGKQLHALLRAAVALGQREELAGVGHPRPGDRPSFALLKDPDYRAIYRGLQLLRHADERFCDEWRVRGQLHQELLLLAAWTWLDLRSEAEPVPNWVRIHPDREGHPSGSRVESLHDGRWLRFSDEAVEEWRVSRREGQVWLQHRLFMEGELIDDAEISLSRRLLGAPAARRVYEHLDAVLAPLLSPVVTPAPRAAPAAERFGPVALSALDPRLLLADGEGAWPGDASAGAMLRVESGAGHGEGALPVLGRPAALLRRDLWGPLGLHRERADLCGQLLKAVLRKARRPEGSDGLAVVVPDRIDELALSRLREGLGECWAVWHSVAVALCWAEEHRPDDALCAGGVRQVLVLALAAAASDVALLSCQLEEGQRVFLRRPPPRRGVSPGESLILAEAGVGADRLRAAWLRAPGAREVWVEEDAAAGDPGGYQRVPLPDPHERLLAEVLPVLEPYRAQPPDVIVLAGGDDRLRATLGELFPSAQVHSVNADAAVRGAQIFLRRHSLGLPTWKEELPPLSAQVRNQHHLREWIEIIAPGQWVRPGERLEFLAKQDLILDPGRQEIDLPLYRGDAAPTPFCLHIAGRPLPLSRPVKVRIALRFRYGQEGLLGELRAQREAPFRQISFSLGAADESAGPAPLVVPEYRAAAPPTPKQEEKIRERFAALRDAWLQVPPKSRRGNKKDAAYWPPILHGPVTALAGAVSAIQGTGPASLGSPGRALLEEVAPWLEWLLGVGKAPGQEGEAPALSPRLRDAVLRARGKCGVRSAQAGDPFLRYLEKILDSSQDRQLREEALKALGGVIDGRPDGVWDALVNAPATSFSDLRWQGWAMSRALYLHPDLAPTLSAEQAERALLLVCEAVGKLPPEEQYRDHFAVFFLAIPHLCRARRSRCLAPDSATVQQALETLQRLQGRLPNAVRTYAPGQRDQDEPVSVALDALRGRKIILPRVEAVQ